MVFPFTFTSMLPYPFSSAAPVEPQPEEVQSPWLLLNMPEQPEYALAAGSTQASPTKRRLPKAPQRVFDHDDREPVPLQRKRGWEPAAPSTVVEPATTSRSVAGRVRFDLQSPFPENSRAGYGMNGPSSLSMADIVPPAPKRRRLGEAILETALSAALIGTAVGITAFRLWRGDKPKAEEVQQHEPARNVESPPPPYYEPVYVPVAVPAPQPVEPPRAPSPAPTTSTSGGSASSTSATAPPAAATVARRATTGARQIKASPRKRATGRSSSRPLAARASTNTLRSTAGWESPDVRELARKKSNATMFDGNMGQGIEMENEEDDDDDGMGEQMDWMSARLQGLIDQGKKALGKEVVVMDESNAHASEEQGAEDDGSHDWEDDDTPLHRALPPSRPHSSLSHARSNASLASMASMASMVSRAPSVVSRAGSVSVSARDMHAPTTSPYKLGGTAHSSSTASLSAAIPRSNQHTPTHSRYRSVGGAPPSAWSPSQQQHGRGRSHTSSSTHLPLSSSGSFDAGSAKPMPMPRRMTSTATLASVSSRIYGNDADEAVISGSPEMRQFMEQARKARMGL